MERTWPSAILWPLVPPSPLVSFSLDLMYAPASYLFNCSIFVAEQQPLGFCLDWCVVSP